MDKYHSSTLQGAAAAHRRVVLREWRVEAVAAPVLLDFFQVDLELRIMAMAEEEEEVLALDKHRHR